MEKRIEWMGDSYESLCAFPVLARRDAGFQLDSVQQGLAPFDWKPMPVIGAGVVYVMYNVCGVNDEK